MGLVSVARYVEITGDTLAETSASAAAPGALRDAQELLEDDLRRPLEAVERTERLELLSDELGLFVLPSALPLVSAAGFTLDGPALRGSFASEPLHAWTSSRRHRVAVTYLGGFQARDADPDVGAEVVPSSIERDVAWAAYVLMRPGQAAADTATAGATSVRLGDAAVSYGGSSDVPSPSRAGIFWSQATWGYRRQRRS